MRKGQRRISRPATTIAQWGVSVGIVVMFVSLAIVVGFKNEVRDKIIGFGCHVIASNYEASANGDSFIIANDDDITALRNIDGVSNVQRFVQKPGLLAVGDEFEGVVVKGIGAEYDRSFSTARSSSLIIFQKPPKSPFSSSFWQDAKSAVTSRVNIIFFIIFCF